MSLNLPSGWDSIIVNNQTDARRAPSPAVSKKRKVDEHDKDVERSGSSSKRVRTAKRPLAVQGAPKRAAGRSEHTENVAVKNKNEAVDECIEVVMKTSQKKVIESGIEFAMQNSEKVSENIEALGKIISENLLTMISKTNYKNVLSGLGEGNVVYTNELRPVSKAYEESYMRQRVSEDEQSCVRKNACECMFIDPTCAFVGVQYKLPWDDGKKEKKNGMCILCTRATTQTLFYDIMFSGVEVCGIIQQYYNEHSKDGEYKLSAMLFCPPNGPVKNMPMPIVRHQRNFYTVYSSRGIYYMKQVNLDFQRAPSS